MCLSAQRTNQKSKPCFFHCWSYPDAFTDDLQFRKHKTWKEFVKVSNISHKTHSDDLCCLVVNNGERYSQDTETQRKPGPASADTDGLPCFAPRPREACG